MLVKSVEPQKHNTDVLIRTPFQNVFIDKNVIEGKEDFVANGKEYILGIYEPYTKEIISYKKKMIGEGFIHTFARYGDAKIFQYKYSAKRAYYQNDFKCRIYQCYIPQGTEYYEGTTENGSPSFAAKRIRFVEKV
jgi:uncharacterized protein YwgA